MDISRPISDIIINKLVLYLVHWIMFGIIMLGSLKYYIPKSQSSKEDVLAFLNRQTFPFNFMVKLYVGKLEVAVPAFMTSSPRTGWSYRLLGSFFPVLTTIGELYSLTFRPINSMRIVISLCFVVLYLFTMLVMWRFGHSLNKR